MFNDRARISALTFLELAIVVLILLLFVFFFIPSNCGHDGTRSKVSRVQSDLRSLAMSIESYYLDQEAYPLAASGALGSNNVPGAMTETLALSTFRIKSGPNDPLYTLTTPIAYSTSYFSDPFAKVKRTTFGYHAATATLADGKTAEGWIMWSAGPDMDYDIDPKTDYAPGPIQPSASLVRKTYDPTNGTKSDGDVWRVKQ